MNDREYLAEIGLRFMAGLRGSHAIITNVTEGGGLEFVDEHHVWDSSDLLYAGDLLGIAGEWLSRPVRCLWRSAGPPRWHWALIGEKRSLRRSMEVAVDARGLANQAHLRTSRRADAAEEEFARYAPIIRMVERSAYTDHANLKQVVRFEVSDREWDRIFGRGPR